MQGGQPSVTFLAASLAAYALIAAITLAAFTGTGASAMLAVSILALVVAAHLGIVLLTQRTSPVDLARALHFPAFVIGVLMFALGAGAALFDGAEKLSEPRALRDASIDYVVLTVVGLVAGNIAWSALREFNRGYNAAAVAPRALKAAEHPALFALVLDSLVMIGGAAVALVGILAAYTLGHPYADGLGSVGVGLVMALTAAALSLEVKALLGASSATARQAIHDALAQHPHAQVDEAPNSIDGVQPGTAAQNGDRPAAPPPSTRHRRRR